jgi:hypothetical protein
MNVKKIAESIPSEIRRKIVLEWLPKAKNASLSIPEFKMLWETFFIYIDPNGVKKEDCPYCLNNVLKNWRTMQPYLVEAEQEEQALEKI